jgi:chitinase
MKISRLFLLLFSLSLFSHLASEAQTVKPKLYDPFLDAKAEIKKAIKQAGSEGKHVLLQVGGNW